MKNYKIYLLDFDGTLVNSAPSYRLPYFLAAKAVGLILSEEAIAEAIHHSMGQTLEMHGIVDEESQKTFIKRFNEEALKPENMKLIKTYAEVPSFLEKGRQKGYRFGIVTGNDERYVDYLLKGFGLREYFEVIVGGSPERKPKPFSDPIDKAREAFSDLPPSDFVYVGDSLQDPECAKNAGIDGILVERSNEYPSYTGTKIPTLDSLL